MKIKTAGYELTVSHLRDIENNPEAGSVWVLNSSAGQRRGDVVLTVARANGIGSDAVIVPATWIPVDLTTVVSRSQLLRDNQFRQALLSGLLTMVNTKEAEELFHHEDASVERKRLSNYMMVGGVAFQQQQAVSNDVEVFGDTHVLEDIPSTVKHLVQRIELAHKEEQLDEEAEEAFEAQLLNLGQLDETTLKWVFHKTSSLAPRVSKAAKRLAGKTDKAGK